MEQVETYLSYIHNFLDNKDYKNKNIYALQDESSLQSINQNIQEINEFVTKNRNIINNKFSYVTGYRGRYKILLKKIFQPAEEMKKLCIMASNN